MAIPALALTGCGGDDAKPAAGGTAAAGTTTASAPTTREYAGEAGTVRVPAHPKRVISVDPATTNILVALGRTPAGAYLNGDEFDPLLGDKAEQITPIGKAEIDIERVAAIKPDLIVGFDYIKDDKTFDELKELAPLATYKYYPQVWQTWTTEVGKIVGAEDEAAKIISDYEAKVAALKPRTQGKSVTIIEPFEDKVWWYGPPSGGGRMLTDLGVDVQPIPKGTALFGVPGVLGEINQERAGELKGDTLIVFTRSIGPEKTRELLAKPIFQDVKAVKSGNVKYVDGQSWVDLGPLNYQVVLDEITKALAE